LGKDGAYATQVSVPARAVHRVPAGLPLVTAALVEPTAVVLKALRKVPDLAGRSVAVVGAGPIGHITAQVLRRLGAEALVVDRDEERLTPFRGLAFSTADSVSERALAGFGTIIEATGSRQAMEDVAAASE